MTTSDVSPLATVLVDVVHALSDTGDVASVLAGLVDRIRVALDADEVGILLADDEGDLALLVGSGADSRDLEGLQLAASNGPCVEVYRTGEPVVVEDVAAATDRWPVWAVEATRLGFASALAAPLASGGITLGAVNLLGRHTGMFGPAQLRMAEALTTVTTVLLLAERRQADSDRLAGQLQQALDSRVLIEQAKGALSERHRVTTGAAFDLLRATARSSGRKVQAVAAETLQYGQ